MKSRLERGRTGHQNTHQAVAAPIEALRHEVEVGALSGPGVPAEKVFGSVRSRIQAMGSNGVDGRDCKW